MNGAEFQITYAFLLPILLCILLLFLMLQRRKQFSQPVIGYSLLHALPATKGKERWAKVPRSLLWAALALFLLALLDPRLLIERPEIERPTPPPAPTEGIAIYLVLDRSGSMTEKVYSGFSRKRISKIDLVRDVTSKFIQGDPQLGLPGRPNDLIGLIFFARGANVAAPLTLDHGAILQQLSHYQHVTDPKQDGTAIGYAIYKAASLIAATRHYAEELISKGEPAYTIKNSIIILLTDGLQDPNPLDKGKRLRNIDIPEAAAYAKSQGIHLYTINVEPKLATEEFLPYRHIMQRASESTGGKFYMMDSTRNLEDVYKEIDRLEKSAIPQAYQVIDKNLRPDLYRRVPFYPYLIAAGLLCLCTSLVLEALWLRRVP